MVDFVDLMKAPDGRYVCANWCDDGTVEVRGEFCTKCTFEEAYYRVLHTAIALVERWSEAKDDEDNGPWEADLVDAVEGYLVLKAEHRGD